MSRKVVSLDGEGWELGQVMHWQSIDDVNRWITATVPGNVRQDLIASGRIEDPYPAKQNELSKWVDDWNWWYKRKIKTEPEGRRTFLRFEGVDYHSHFFLNGRKVAENEGMFAPVVLEVTELMRAENDLCVCIEYAGQYRQREETLKCQMGFGWDFAPEIKTAGIWDSVSMIHTGEVFIARMDVEPLMVTENYWELRVTVECDANREVAAKMDFTVEPKNFKGPGEKHDFEMLIPHGKSEHIFNLPMRDPKLWNIWEEGPRNLYRLRLAIRKERLIIDDISTRFGVRSVELKSIEGRGNDEWSFVINGKHKFIRGANWVPADSLPGSVTKERYRKLLNMAKKANINMLRVWGGGLREKKHFYDLCDELGILVWQEFPFACPRGRNYPTDANFRQLVNKEVTGILHKLHNHPSVAMYCGGNEFSYSRNRRMINRIEHFVKKYGGGRPFKHSSPSEGDIHNWKIFHMMANINDYRQVDASFMSEFGLQAVPCRESLEKFIPRDNHWPIEPKMPYSINEVSYLRSEKLDVVGRLLPGGGREKKNAEIWTYHDAHLNKIFRYAEQIGFHDIFSFIDASQKIQALGLKTAIEHMRRRRSQAGGVMFWQFNEPWPSICWSVVDYYLQPKLAYHWITMSFAPLMVSLDFKPGPYKPDQDLKIDVYVINDLHKVFDKLEVEIILENGVGTELEKLRLDAGSVTGDSIKRLESVKVNLQGEAGWNAVCRILRNGKEVHRNFYDLSIADKRPTMKPVEFLDKIHHNVIWK